MKITRRRVLISQLWLLNVNIAFGKQRPNTIGMENIVFGNFIPRDIWLRNGKPASIPRETKKNDKSVDSAYNFSTEGFLMY